MKKNIALLLLCVSTITQLAVAIDIREIRNDSDSTYSINNRTIRPKSTILAKIPIPVGVIEDGYGLRADLHLDEEPLKHINLMPYSAYISVSRVRPESEKMMTGGGIYKILMHPVKKNSILLTFIGGSTGLWSTFGEYNFTNNKVRLVMHNPLNNRSYNDGSVTLEEIK